MFEIEKGVPAPSAPRNAKYPFRNMEIGDSFFVPDDKASEDALRSSASAFGKHNSIKLKVKRVEGGLRVWRIA